tara:strand:- start:4336 stop:5889 length:1554 start_codon:yes stop_codon:yes gene_type:complete
MGKKSTPAAPDYTGAAEATAESSRELATANTTANRPDQITPWGTSTWDSSAGIDPSTGLPVTNWTQNLELSGQQQEALDSQMAVQAGRSDLAEGLIDRAGSELANPVDWNGMPAPAGTPEVPDFYGQNLPSMGTAPNAAAYGQNQFDYQGNYNRLAQYGEGPQQQGYAMQGAQTTFDPTTTQAQEQNFQQELRAPTQELDANGGFQQRFADQQFERQMSLMSPQHEQAKSELENRLRNMGMNAGDASYDQQLQNLRTQQGEEVNRLTADSVRFGTDQQQAAFGRQFQTRGQQQQEALQQGNFSNSASQMRGNQQMQLQDLQYQQAQGRGQFANQARQQMSQEQLAAGGQQFDQSLAASNYQNSLRGQQFGELNQLQEQTGAAAQGQFDREMSAAQYQDAQRRQLSQEQLAMGGQGFSQQMQAANYQNTLRQQAITEEMQRRGMSINEMNALLSGQQVGMPGMPDFNQATMGQATDYLGAANMQGNFDQASFGTNAGMFNAALGMAGNIGNGLAMPGS